MVPPIAPLGDPTSRTCGHQRSFCTPSTSSASRAPHIWCSADGREYRRPNAGALLTLCALRVNPTSLACCPSTMTTIPRLVGTRSASCRAVHLPSLRVSCTAESCRLLLKCKDRCLRCVLLSVEGVLCRLITFGPCTALELIAALVSRVCRFTFGVRCTWLPAC